MKPNEVYDALGSIRVNLSSIENKIVHIRNTLNEQGRATIATRFDNMLRNTDGIEAEIILIEESLIKKKWAKEDLK